MLSGSTLVAARATDFGNVLRLSPLDSQAAAFAASIVFHVGAVALAATPATLAMPKNHGAAQAVIDMQFLPASASPREVSTTRAAPVERVRDVLPHPRAAIAHHAHTVTPDQASEPAVALPHFDMAPARSTDRVALARFTLSESNASSAAAGAHEITLAAERISVPAHLLKTARATYPDAARRAELEANVPVEIVIDERGRVTEARAIGHAGYGLDEEAARAIRNYRFAPAEREGRPVRVRMRWDVLFSLH
ncbi:MAG TPA: energy transducer TonB [Polyangiales bacterium]|nr:energy transducer TonB [Polyangiales bacterium]